MRSRLLIAGPRPSSLSIRQISFFQQGLYIPGAVVDRPAGITIEVNNDTNTRQAPLPRISVITPSFNHARFLAAAMDSVLSQRYPGLEYIVMDGGSKDGSAEIIRARADGLAYWQSEQDGGQANALNLGLS